MIKVLFKALTDKKESTFDVDALMTFTVITIPFFILIYTYKCIFF